jgi:futalosine hydrolase
MKFIALLSSMPFETDLILSLLKNIRNTKIAGKTVYKGRLSGSDILILNTGIGKVNAAHSATCVIEHFPFKQMINLGVGGAYPGSGLKIGDIAIASKEIYGDDGVITSNGREGLKKIGIPLVQVGKKKYFNEFPISNPPLIPPFPGGDHGRGFSFASGNKMEERDFKIKSGNFVTVSATTGTHKRAAELEKRFNAVCENMEGAAIAQVCTIYKVPLLEIRGISNIAGVRDKRKWNLKLASKNCQDMVLNMMDFLI